MSNKKKALIVVDLQNDFVREGALAINRGEEIVPLIDTLVHLNFDLIIATKDWHPLDHGSFHTQHNKNPGEVVHLGGVEQILWPVHCVQDSFGAEFVKGWDTTKINKIFYKGIDKTIDSYSTFFDNNHKRSTGLFNYLQQNQISELYFAGLATDYCVKFSAMDGCFLGFKTFVVIDACRAVNLKPNDEKDAIAEMKNIGIELVTVDQVINNFK